MSAPFLKWAGGKQRLLSQLLPHLGRPKVFVEPFLGGGAVFLALEAERYILSDLNPELISLYKLVQSDPDTLLTAASHYFRDSKNNSTDYYRLREKYNKEKSSIRKSALFLYLNRHGFNGLYRVNKEGLFNVPFGQYDKPKLPDKEIYAAHKKLFNADIICCDYRETLLRARSGMTVYADPPYIPMGNSEFNYVSQFSLEDHKNLAGGLRAVAARGCLCVLSNHDIPITRALYSDAQLIEAKVSRSIGADIKSRGSVGELIAVYDGTRKAKRVNNQRSLIKS